MYESLKMDKNSVGKSVAQKVLPVEALNLLFTQTEPPSPLAYTRQKYQ